MEVVFPQALRAESEFDSTLEFFQKLLRDNSRCHLIDEYPLAFSSQRIENIFVSKLNNELHAGLVTLEREIEVRKGEWARALFIGSVVTSPEHRHRGLQRHLFHSVEETAEKNKIDFLVLWSNQLEFYQKLGFELAGLQASWIATHRAPLVRGPSNIRVQVIESSSARLRKEHFESFDKKICRVKRSFEDMESLFRIPQMTIASTERAYALMGKGEDFAKVCHEWSGPAEEVLACFDALRAVEPAVRILSPGVLHDADEGLVVQALENASFENRLEYLGLFKVISDRIDSEKFSPEDLQYPFFIWGLDSI